MKYRSPADRQNERFTSLEFDVEKLSSQVKILESEIKTLKRQLNSDLALLQRRIEFLNREILSTRLQNDFGVRDKDVCDIVIQAYEILQQRREFEREKSFVRNIEATTEKSQ